MWMVQNQTPYGVSRGWVQDKDANKLWLVVVQATFDIFPDGTTRLADVQEPPPTTSRHVGEPFESSLRYESELFGVKVNTDVLLNATAYAPKGRAASTVEVEMTVGALRKRLRVLGDRVWLVGALSGLVMSRPAPFVTMPIVYERAYGGWDRSGADPTAHRLEARNPIGVGLLSRSEHYRGVRLPNIELPDTPIQSWSDRPAPAGFGPLECHWSPRRELAGTYDQRWREHRLPLWADDFDQRYNNCAPSDQQASGFLRGGERVDLWNLSPSGRLSFSLPRVYPFFRTRFGHEYVDHRARLSTVTIEPDVSRVMLCWQTSLVCNHRVDELDSTVVTEKRAG